MLPSTMRRRVLAWVASLASCRAFLVGNGYIAGSSFGLCQCLGALFERSLLVGLSEVLSAVEYLLQFVLQCRVCCGDGLYPVQQVEFHGGCRPVVGVGGFVVMLLQVYGNQPAGPSEFVLHPADRDVRGLGLLVCWLGRADAFWLFPELCGAESFGVALP